MDLIKYLKHPNTYIATAMVAAPVLGGLARLLAGGDFIEGARQVIYSQQIGTLYLLLTGVAMIHHTMRRGRNLPNNIDVVNGARSEI